jgi:hypothetical protein
VLTRTAPPCLVFLALVLPGFFESFLLRHSILLGRLVQTVDRVRFMNQSANEAPPLTAEHVCSGSASQAQRRF